ncbi:MAG: DUF4249 domain-containing protein [Chitinophagales bacterium]
MKNHLTLVFLLIFASILVSCEEEDFSTTVEVDLSEYGNQLVVLAPFKTDVTLDVDTLWYNHFYLVLTKSNDILNEDQYFERIEDAVVDLFEEGEYNLTLNHWERGIYISNANTGIEAGKNYHIEIHSPEYGKVTAKSYIPKRVKVLKALMSNSNYYDALEDVEKVEFTIEIEDEANVENFYYLNANIIVKLDSSDYDIQTDLTFNDPIFDKDDFNSDFLEIEEFLNPQFDWSVTFRDELFEGQRKSLKIYLKKSDLEGSVYDPDTGFFVEAEREIYFIIGAMSRDLYLYKRSALSQSRIAENPFAEAIRVYSNIEGGVGIFAGFVEDTVWLK